MPDQGRTGNIPFDPSPSSLKLTRVLVLPLETGAHFSGSTWLIVLLIGKPVPTFPEALAVDLTEDDVEGAEDR